MLTLNLQRLKQYFENVLRSSQRPKASAKRGFLKLQNEHRRAEQSIHAYHRLYKDMLNPLIAADFEQHSGEMQFGAHRNKFLAERLQQESEEVKNIVEESRRKATEPRLKEKKQNLKWIDQDDIDEEELSRRVKAVEYDE